MDRRPQLRRSMTLAEQLATPDPAIRDFLRVPDDHHPGATDAGAGRSGWKPLRDRLRQRRATNAWTATPSQKPGALKSGGSGSTRSSHKYIYAPGEATAAFSRTVSLRQTPTFSRVGPTVSRADRAAPGVVVDDHDDEEEEDDDEEDDGGKDHKDEAPAAHISLMALLGQSDSWDDDDEEDEAGGGKNERQQADDEDEDGEGREEEMVHVCCVCMVRHKGAAFIPCGHTFCRLCSRELWVSRGNCPLCNGFIQEILDIF